MHRSTSGSDGSSRAMHGQPEGIRSADIASLWATERDDQRAGRNVSVREQSEPLFIVETAPLATNGQHQLAKWVAAEATARGFAPQFLGVGELVPEARPPLVKGDVVLMMLHQPAIEAELAEVTVSWERWSQVAAVVIEAGAVLILVTAGTQAAGVAACLGVGGHAVVEVDHAEVALDVARDVLAGRLSGFELSSVLRCPYDEDQLARLGSLTTIELRILFYLTKGYAADRIASVEWISLSTVRTHIRSIFRKLGVNSQLAAVAVANGTAVRDLVLGDSPSVVSEAGSTTV